MRRLPLFLLLLLACGALAADTGRDSPRPTLPYTPGLDPSFMDKSVDPCVDFYAYSCAGWQKLNPIPADQSTWSVYGKLQDEIQRHLWGLDGLVMNVPEFSKAFSCKPGAPMSKPPETVCKVW